MLIATRCSDGKYVSAARKVTQKKLRILTYPLWHKRVTAQFMQEVFGLDYSSGAFVGHGHSVYLVRVPTAFGRQGWPY